MNWKIRIYRNESFWNTHKHKSLSIPFGRRTGNTLFYTNTQDPPSLSSSFFFSSFHFLNFSRNPFTFHIPYISIHKYRIEIKYCSIEHQKPPHSPINKCEFAWKERKNVWKGKVRLLLNCTQWTLIAASCIQFLGNIVMWWGESTWRNQPRR